MPDLAKSVVYRHPCDCDSASRPLEPGEKAEHVFEVDGKPFPWFLTERGAAFALGSSGLYIVRVEIFVLRRDNESLIFGTFSHSHGQLPVIDGIEFPWWVTEAGLMYVSSRKDAPVVRLSFLAEHLDTDTEIAGAGDVFEMTGNLIARAEASQ